ncbi:hypothetical protein N7462_003211 [Penicillium macrosclerotiorum]|uniref:uncharacterized protein n=1 Tax=Penicillium macrosclerotiorum TaxID=303699 RepID=UPI00254907B4|nr:uncharacterized protein N7462_003211 [Penicillium macrosclerotiorum]KAJ5688819.1 hypothetical protein N7462_003211 [Penicillium macrosclerotiorum]
MRSQVLLALGGLLLTGNLAIAAKLEHEDVSNRCWDACGPVVGISERCDHQHDSDSAELNCICTWDSAKTQIPLCAACISVYGDSDQDEDHDEDWDEDDNEALDLVRSCNFSTTTYNAAAATTLSASATTTDSAATTATATSGADSTGGSSGTSAGSSSATGSSSSSGTASPTETGAAADLSAPAISVLALAGLVPLAWL